MFRSTLLKAKRDGWLGGYLMVAPTLVFLAVFIMWPIAQSFFLSFTKWGGFGKWTWSGFDNFIRLAGDEEVIRSFGNTIILALVSVPVAIGISIVLAVLLNQKIRGVGVYRVLFFLPVVTMPAATAMVWRWLYNGDYGLINAGLAQLGIDGPNWTTDPRTALGAVIVVAIWSDIGMNVVLLLAGLQGISSSYYEAASLDGAGPFTKFFKITVPLLTPTIFLASVIGVIGNLQIFDLIYLMIGSNNPALGAAQTATFQFYEQAFIYGDRGYASTIVLVLFLIIAVFSVIQFRLQKRWVHYE